MPTESVIIDHVATTATAHPGTKRHLVNAHRTDASGFAVQYLTVDDGLAAKCIAAAATKEVVEARWQDSAWGYKLIGLEFPEPTPQVAADLAERIRQRERAELGLKIDGVREAYQSAEAQLCRGCFRKWSVTDVAETRPQAAHWIPEAEAYWHSRCWQRAKERSRQIASEQEL